MLNSRNCCFDDVNENVVVAVEKLLRYCELASGLLL